jgi:FtsH-binding integral membrane protein
MSNYDQDRLQQTQYGASARAGIDEGLRSYMLRVYNYMAGGLALTGFIAYFTFQAAVQETAQGLMLTSFGQVIYQSPLAWVIMLSPLAFVLVLSFGINKLSLGTSQILFWAFAGVMGLSLSSIFLRFTGESITTTFFVTAAAFGSLSLYGYTTKRDLSPIGSFLFMGLIGLVIAMVVNIFLQSSAVRDFGDWRADLRRPHRLGYAADQGNVLCRRQCRRGGQEGDHGRVVALSRLHQPVHVPAAVHG